MIFSCFGRFVYRWFRNCVEVFIWFRHQCESYVAKSHVFRTGFLFIARIDIDIYIHIHKPFCMSLSTLSIFVVAKYVEGDVLFLEEGESSSVDIIFYESWMIPTQWSIVTFELNLNLCCRCQSILLAGRLSSLLIRLEGASHFFYANWKCWYKLTSGFACQSFVISYAISRYVFMFCFRINSFHRK